MSDPLLLMNDDDPQITVVILNRPAKRNALNITLIDQISNAVNAASNDRNRRAMIFRGNGPLFCAGLDLTEASAPDRAHRSAEALERMYRLIAQSPLITIAAAHGAAMGGGAGLLAACDFVIAGDDLKLSYPEVKRGLIAALVTCLLRRQFTDRTVRELILLGQTVGAARAREMGLVTKVVPASTLMQVAMQFAHETCAGAPGAIARSKRLLDQLAPRPIADDLKMALDYHLSARQSVEAQEGIAAFLEKRPPKWGPRSDEL